MALQRIQLASFDDDRVSFAATFDDVTGDMTQLHARNASGRDAFARISSANGRVVERTVASGFDGSANVPAGQRPKLRAEDGASFEFSWPA